METTPKNATVENDPQYPTHAEVLEMIDRRIAALQIYIVESDITQAQNAVRAVVSEASF